MNPFHEKLTFGATLLASSMFSALGAIFTSGETRWLFVTFTVSFLMSGFLALMFKKPEDTIQLVIGRCGFSIISGIFGTYQVVERFGISSARTDIISLGGIAAGVCIAAFLIGFALLRIVESKAPQLADKLFKRYTP